MLEHERKLIEDNLNVVKYVVSELMAKYNIPKSEYEDYCQTGYLMLCSKVYRYDGSTEFKTFADKVLRNGFIDMYRTKHDIKAESLDATMCDDEGNEEEFINFLAVSNNTENEVIAKVTTDMLKEHIARVKENCAAKTTVRGFEALELKMQGYTGAEIAKMFDVPANSLRSWMSKAKKLLLNDNSIQNLLCDYYY